MKITLTGSLGRIGKPLAQKLIALNHEVKIITSTKDRQQDIEALGATPFVGDLTDSTFLAEAFQGADAVYTMVPPANYFDPNLELYQHFVDAGDAFAKAIQTTQTKNVVNLSSIGAHLESGNGILEGTYYVEQILNALENVNVVHIRPVEIYYNLYQFIPLIKNKGIIGSNLAPDTFNAWVAVEDIADAVVDEITNVPLKHKVRYVTSQEVTYDELAKILGSAIGKPDLQWVQFTDEQVRDNLIEVGMNPKVAPKMTEMYAAIRSGKLYEHYHDNKPEEFGTTKIATFSNAFAEAYKAE